MCDEYKEEKKNNNFSTKSFVHRRHFDDVTFTSFFSVFLRFSLFLTVYLSIYLSVCLSSLSLSLSLSVYLFITNLLDNLALLLLRLAMSRFLLFLDIAEPTKKTH